MLGVDFDMHATPIRKRVLLEPLFKSLWIKQTNLYPFFTNFNVILKSSQKSADSVVEKHEFVNKKTGKHLGECQLTYSNSIPYQTDISICRELDSLRQMKLTQFVFTFEPSYVKQFGIISGKYYSFYRLEKIDIPNKGDIMRYFNDL